jgi:hypothetical protein
MAAQMAERRLEAAGSGTLKISAMIMPQNWNSDGRDGVLPTGEFELDDVDADGPPSSITIKQRRCRTAAPSGRREKQGLGELQSSRNR